MGDVTVADRASVWYGCVVRGDQNAVSIGAYTNVQDRAVLTTAKALPSGFPASLTLGNFVSVGHGSVLRSCTVEDNSSIGMYTCRPERVGAVRVPVRRTAAVK